MKRSKLLILGLLGGLFLANSSGLDFEITYWLAVGIIVASVFGYYFFKEWRK
jgi:hypothetical protein